MKKHYDPDGRPFTSIGFGGKITEVEGPWELVNFGNPDRVVRWSPEQTPDPADTTAAVDHSSDTQDETSAEPAAPRPCRP